MLDIWLLYLLENKWKSPEMPQVTELPPDKTVIIGRRLLKDGRVRQDKNEELILRLTHRKLKRVGSYLGTGAFEDPSDSRIWERVDYLGLMGGGPYLLHIIPKDTANDVYARESTLEEAERYRERLRKLTPLEPDETILLGTGFTHAPPIKVAKRIQWLIENKLEYVAGHGGHILYKDPKDSRYWELIHFEYPPMALGGGLKEIYKDPHLLHVVDRGSAARKYGLLKVYSS